MVLDTTSGVKDGDCVYGRRFCAKKIPKKEEDPLMMNSGQGVERGLNVIWILRMVLKIVIGFLLHKCCSRYVHIIWFPISSIE